MLDKALELARMAGFEHSAALNVSALVLRPEVRQMCAADRCERYGRSWSCPPACGTLETLTKRFSHCTEGVLVQTEAKLADSFDFEAMAKAEKLHKSRFDTLARQMKLLDKSCIPLSAGSCTRCRKCTYPTKPCRYPAKLYYSMEACGLLVADVCTASGLKYKYSDNSMVYSSCVLF